MGLEKTTLKILINSQKEIRMDLRLLTKSIDKGLGNISDRLGSVEDWKAGHIGYKKGAESKEAKTIGRVTFVTVVVSAVLAVCGFFWAVKPSKRQPVSHLIVKNIVEQVVKDKMGLK